MGIYCCSCHRHDCICTELSMRVQAAVEAAADTNIPDNWLPTPANINALPEPVRDYIMGLETNADPSGMVRQNVLLKDENETLRLKIKEMKL